MSELSGQVAIVTGGASGIGAASVELLAQAGATVISTDIQPRAGGAGRFVQHDVTSEEAWKALLADVLGSEGRLDILVNNAGVSGGWGTIEIDDRRAMAPGRGDQFRGRVPRLQVCDRGHEGDGGGQA